MGDDQYVYTDDERQRLTVNLVRLATDVHEGHFSSDLLGTELLCRLHHELFLGIRDHAGKLRSAGFGSERLTFGPNRSSHRNQVNEELVRAFADAHRTIASCEQNPNAEGYARAAFYVAVWLHSRIVQIHPFQDGNGRTSRLVMNIVLVRLGLRPVAVEIPKDEYNAALNAFFNDSVLEPVIDVLLPCCVSATERG